MMQRRFLVQCRVCMRTSRLLIVTLRSACVKPVTVHTLAATRQDLDIEYCLETRGCRAGRFLSYASMRSGHSSGAGPDSIKHLTPHRWRFRGERTSRRLHPTA
nr:hypothetical protein CFP56_58755 [Quercus suber]